MLTSGQFFGNTNETVKLAGLTLTDTEYTHAYVDWHYHENAYLTFILEGNVLEGNKQETYDCKPGSLLFHNSEEPHYNIKPEGFTRGFHIELAPEWWLCFDLDIRFLQGSINLQQLRLKTIMYNILKEMKLDKDLAGPAIDSLLINFFVLAGDEKTQNKSERPVWVNKIRDLVHDFSFDYPLPLSQMSQHLNIHPVHLSRSFSRYFGCNLGEYLRMIKIQRALALLPNRQFSLTDIALKCGFSDQSHFIRSFKMLQGITPMAYRKLLL